MFGVYDLFLEQVKYRPEKLALVCQGEELTYRDLNDRINAVSDALRMWGVQKGDKVGLLLKNSVQFIELFYALIKIGACIYPFNFRLAIPELLQLQERVKCRYFIAEDEYTAFLDTLVEQQDESGADAPRERVIRATISPRGYDADVMSFERNGDASWDYKEEMATDDKIYTVFTGGTTGLSKAAIYTQQSALVMTLGFMLDATETNANVVHQMYTPMFHVSSINSMLKAFATGGTFVLIRNFDAKEYLDLIERYHATQISLVPPAIMNRLLDVLEKRDYDLSSIQLVHLTAGRSDEEIVEKLFDLMPDVACESYYAHTESALALKRRYYKDEFLANPSVITSLGHPCPVFEIRLVGEDGEEVPDGVIGEAYGRSKSMISGYEGTPNPFTDDGWFPTGDLMKRDPETGEYSFVSRSKDMIKSGGENVYATEVESAIMHCCNDEVLDCAVVGLPDKEWGELVVAAIILRKGAKLAEQELKSKCDGAIAHYKLPKRVFFVDSFPRDSVDKVRKNELREKLLASLKN